MPQFSLKYGDSFYLKNCKELSGYEFPGDNWKGATLIIEIDGGILLIKRAGSMPTHANQWGTFGGRRAEGESDPRVVAEREFSEESGIAPSSLNFVSYLPPVYTAANQIIISCSAELKMEFKQFQNVVISNGEWDYGVWLPLKELEKESLWSYGNRYGATTSSQILFYEINRSNVLFFGPKKPDDELPIFWEQPPEWSGII